MLGMKGGVERAIPGRDPAPRVLTAKTRKEDEGGMRGKATGVGTVESKIRWINSRPLCYISISGKLVFLS